MKTVGFIGAYDKTDLIVYVAKILSLSKKKILIIDATVNQKTKYIVPSINPTKTYITEFEGIDFAIGFKNIDDIKEYLGNGNKPLEYDIALLDIDSEEMIKNYDIQNSYKNCFVTGFDLYTLKRGLELLSNFSTPINITKVFFSLSMVEEENEYLNYLSSGYKINWEKEIYNFPIELDNYSVTIDSQIVSRINIKGLSVDFKESLKYFIENVFSGDISEKEISRIFKNIERET